MDSPAHTPDQQQGALGAIRGVLHSRWSRRTGLVAPVYPDAVANLSGHLTELIDIAERTRHCTGQASRLAGAVICAKCPFEFPPRDCPIRKTNQCALHELAEPILNAVRLSQSALPSPPQTTAGRAS